MNMDQALRTVRNWARQTILFTLSIQNVEKPKVPMEVLEIQGHRAHEIENQLYAEALAACADDPPVPKVIETFARKVLDWVVENHKC